MELNEFAVNYPELYVMMDEDVRYALAEYKMTGDESLRDWDGMIDNLVEKYEQQDYYGYDMDVITAQQFGDGFRDRGRDDRNRRRRRRFRDFNTRDIIRILFLRKLFDRNRRFTF